MFRKAEAELRHTLQMLSDIQLALSESSIVTVVNHDGFLIYLNKLASQILECPEPARPKTQALEFLMPNQEAVLEDMYRSLRNGLVWHGELQTRSSTGKTYWVQTTTVPFLGKDGRAAQYISISTDISLQKAVELGLKEREEQLHTLINALPGAVLFQDAEGRLLEANEQALALVKATGQSWIGKRILEITNNPAAAKYASEWEVLSKQAYAEHEPVQYETLRKTEHEDNYIYGSIIPLFYGDGTKHGVVIIERDVTELKKSQIELTSVHEIFESIVQNGTDAIAIADLDGEVIRVNPAWERTYGWSAEEVVGRVLPFETDQSAQWREIAKHGSIVPNMEVVRQRKDGTFIHVSITTSPIFDGQGKVSALCGITRDITERVESEKALLEARQQLESFIEQSADAISVTTLQGDILRINPSFERIFGWSREEIVGQPTPFRSPQEQLEITEWLQRIQSGQQVSALETIRHSKDGTPVQISITASPIYDQEGNVVAMSVISRDITAQVANKELLGRSEKLSLVGQMAAGVAHEIRNPLASLQGFAQLIREQTSDNLIQKYTDIMTEEFFRISSIINEFLMLAKPQKVQHQRSSLTHILMDVITLIQTQAHEKNLVLTYQFINQDVFIDCVESELKQVFINILKNAVEATPAGRRIDLALLQLTNSQVLVRCTDQGCGIPKEHVAKVGSPFFTTKASGTGLGLMVTQRIIESHGGRITIQSEENVGTTVEVMLRVHHSESDTEETDVACL